MEVEWVGLLWLLRVVKDPETKQVSVSSKVFSVVAKVSHRKGDISVLNYFVVCVPGRQWQCSLSRDIGKHAELLLLHHRQRQAPCHSVVPCLGLRTRTTRVSSMFIYVKQPTKCEQKYKCLKTRQFAMKSRLAHDEEQVW